jgi:DNA-binding MarR family transcriptional regulator
MGSVSSVSSEMMGECIVMRARLVARVVTSLYDEALRPFGIQASQLNLLVAVAQAGPIRRSDLAKAFHLDSSTLTRNLRVMETNGWIEEVSAGSDGRGFPVRISKKGEAAIAKVAPAWRSAQRRAAELLGADAGAALSNVSAELVSVLR